MSGIVGSCIVCGKFHATGDFGDDAVVMMLHGIMVVACPSCLPLAPAAMPCVCVKCGAASVQLRWPPETWGHKHQSEYVCRECLEAYRHMDLHKRIAKLKAAT